MFFILLLFYLFYYKGNVINTSTQHTVLHTQRFIHIFTSIRALALVVLKSYIAIFSTTNHKNGATMVEL